MDEIASYLREEAGNDQIIIQEVWEHQRLKNNSWFINSTYNEKYLNLNDPSHWIQVNNFNNNNNNNNNNKLIKQLKCLSDIHIPPYFVVLVDWKFETNILTSKRGWIYSENFLITSKTYSTHTSDTRVRRRLWQRLLVNNYSYTLSKTKLYKFQSQQVKYRTLCPSLIKSALKNYEFHIQMVLESERIKDGNFNSANLLTSDPPHWSCGTDDDLLTDPRIYLTENLQEVKLSSFDRSNGWDFLHEFIYTFYPNKDETGWEYNRDFNKFDGWTNRPTYESCVRRRLWMRTCVKNNVLYECRQKLQVYISSHSRGICKHGQISRQSLQRKKWTKGMAVLTDRYLELNLEKNYRSHYIYPLEGCEVVSLTYDNSNTIFNNEQTFTGTQLNYETHSNNQMMYQFGLRKLTTGGGDLGLVCILNASSQSEKDAWIAAIGHQCALVNLIFWPFSFGPPISDRVLVKGEMWKKGHLVPSWKFRTFELRQNGTLAYFKGSELKGKIRLRGCILQDELENGEFTFSLRKKNGYILYLRTTDRQTNKLWKDAITAYITCSTNNNNNDNINSNNNNNDNIIEQNNRNSLSNLENIGSRLSLTRKEEIICRGRLPLNVDKKSNSTFYQSISSESQGTFIPSQPINNLRSLSSPPIPTSISTSTSILSNSQQFDQQQLQQQQQHSYPQEVEEEIKEQIESTLVSESLNDQNSQIINDEIKVDENYDNSSNSHQNNQNNQTNLTTNEILITPVRGMNRRATVGPGVIPSSSKHIESTHHIEINKNTGRRVSVLNYQVMSEVYKSGVWEASDDENDNNNNNNNNNNNINNEENDDKRNSNEPIVTHTLKYDSTTGRKKSILRHDIKTEVEESGIWEADDDDDEEEEENDLRSDSESENRSTRTRSARLSSFNVSTQYEHLITANLKLFEPVEETEEDNISANTSIPNTPGSINTLTTPAKTNESNLYSSTPNNNSSPDSLDSSSQSPFQSSLPLSTSSPPPSTINNNNNNNNNSNDNNTNSSGGISTISSLFGIIAKRRTSL